ncbi:MAG TPA: DNA polymerase/3'-5' exonuclease PolX [Planctomycetaceae bacterium]|nr:DNA polymerase/3'-5' exonuclease PolX [Planctomycetaceae bacterium]
MPESPDAPTPLNNAQIAEIFEQLADLLEFQNENPFRVRAYRNAARAIRDYPGSIAALARSDPRELEKIPGIGRHVAEKCAVIVETGRLPQLEELKKQIPASVLDLLRIPGMGPKKAAALYRELHIETLDDLKKACESHRVQKLKGFGAKTEEAILKALERSDLREHRILWAQADAIVQSLRGHLSSVAEIRQLEVAGSYRRGKETVGDLDLLVDAEDAAPAMDRLATFPGVAEVLARGSTKMSVRLESNLQIDLRVVPTESFGAALQYFTGSKAHNVHLRHLARQRKLKINEYGVFDESGKKERRIAGETEASVYASLDLPCFPPEIRENRFEFAWAEDGELPALVELEDIRGDLHMHTTETDGRNSLEEMCEAAIGRGLKYIAITDHSQRVTMANGLTPQRLRRQWKAIDKLNEKYGRRLHVLKGVECDILEKGGLDLPDDVLAEADWVVASVHYGQNQSREQITERILGALEHPAVCAIAHPTGRLLNRRPPYEVDLEAVLDAAARNHKLMELNANPYRLDLNDVYCQAAREKGIPIVISTDAHSTTGLDAMRYGVLQARRGGLTASDVANARPFSKFMQLVRRARKV